MTAIDYSRSDPFARTRPTVANRTAGWIANSYRTWKNRRAFYQLAEMTDVELRDIGLVRSDLSVPMNVTLDFDPTAHLGKVARQRINSMETLA
ncbi:MAG TPA: DUF1127 domain-containing protein [Mesorhizobium sp.]